MPRHEEELPRNSQPNEAPPIDRVTSEWVADPYAHDQYMERAYEPAGPVQQERLFPRKVLIGWALAALTLWFLVSVIGPMAAHTAKERIVRRLEERGVTSRHVIIRSDPVTPAAPVIPSAPVIPAVPVIPPVPAIPASPSIPRTPAKASRH